jgi:hypothetical protein
MTAENQLLLSVFVCGALIGLLSRWAPLSGWAALAFPLLFPLIGVGLAERFC